MTRTRIWTLCACVAALIASVMAVTNATAGGSGPGSSPTITRDGPLNEFVLGNRNKVQWTATDDVGIISRDTLALQKYWNDPSQLDPFLAGDPEIDEQTYLIGSGWTQCVSPRVQDQTQAEEDKGTSLPASEIPCFAGPVDDTDLVASPGDWTRNVARGHYLNTFSMTRKQGATLELQDAFFSHLAVVVTKCPGCGTIRVFSETNSNLKTFSLDAPQVKKAQVVKIPVSLDPTRTQRAGSLGEEPTPNTVTIKVTSNDKPVKIEGVGVIDRNFRT